ncbi:ewing's tumor-associated antigen 1 homolog isoform X2 [Myxocyprinus asiaticus]|uniref:ewing's tumor-associated antigen 1 homolog isoform X2 n=1 Tax=Myxocyprinus asiaticus TaxID=70543 RepID=UPI002222147D|nr:ewing's tumor-associated antigen 1 homolog isoform X2 [Myxocyprinus asiaticus]
MTDKRSIGVRLKSDGARESRSRTSKLPQNRMQTKRHVIGLQDSQSPSYHKSFNYRKDFTTPKRRPRIRYNSCYSGDSPNETEYLQDIIWDPNSPTQSLNGNGGDGRVIEISEIVNRIAPKVERPKEGDSVLQWIGDSAIPCTPEIRQPRVRRISARQSNVEDLMKLAKQFDINMTRQDKEKRQKSIENLNQLKSQSDGTTKSTPASVAIMTEEEELRALFDGPTQHLSGRLSPPSANCTPEGRTDPAALAEQSSSSAIKNASAPKASEVDFDDDWENDDLLNDSFVLEMTQNQVPLNVAEKPCATQPKSCSRKCKSVAKTNSSVSNSRDICLQIQQSTSKSSTFTRTCPEVQTSTQSTFRLKPQDQTTEQLLRTSLVDQVKHQAQSNEGKTSKDCEASGQTSTATFDGVSKEDLKSLFDSDGLWNDEDDDDLLCQACDDVERISASQEEQRHSKDYAELDKSRSLTSRNTIYAETMGINSKSSHVFVRSNSVPCSSGSSGLKQDYGVLATTKGSSSGMESYIPYYYGQAQNKLTEVKNASAPSLGFVSGTSQTIMPQSITVGKASNSHHFTFKRHLSDSVTLANKVFISSSATVKCSAAEIDRKKQEAIARRRLRMQASQKNGAPT